MGGLFRLQWIWDLVPMGMVPIVGENPRQMGDDGLIVDVNAEFPPQIEGAPIDVHRAQDGSPAIGQNQFRMQLQMLLAMHADSRTLQDP